MAAASAKHVWAFQRRLRRGAFGWKNTTARNAMKEALAELRAAARSDPALAAEGCVRLVERIPPAFERVDDSSGALQGDIRKALDLLTELLERSEADEQTHARWLARLWTAYEHDEMPWIEGLADRWGALCITAERAAAEADRLTALEADLPEPAPGEFVSRLHIETPLLSALHRAGRFEAILERLPEASSLWFEEQWAIAALRNLGRRAEALRRIREIPADHRGQAAERVAEAILLESGMEEEAWTHHALRAAEDGSRVRWLRTLRERYPRRTPEAILDRLVATTPGSEGRWFAAARQAGMLDAALALAERTPAEPATLITAVKNHAESDPAFAHACGRLAAEGLAAGHAFDPDKIDVDALAWGLVRAARALGREVESDEPLLEAMAQHASPVAAYWIRLLAPALQRARRRAQQQP